MTKLVTRLKELRKSGRKVRIYFEGGKYPIRGVIKEVGEDYVKVDDSLIAQKAITAVVPIKEVRPVHIKSEVGEMMFREAIPEGTEEHM